MNEPNDADDVLAKDITHVESNPKRNTTKKSKGKKKPVAKKPEATSNVQSNLSGKAKRSFPGVALEDALKVPQVIRQKNNGHPWSTEQVAIACGTTHKTNKFFYLAAASRDYGLTSGSRDAPLISLTELGRSLLFASSAEIEEEKNIEAFFYVEKLVVAQRSARSTKSCSQHTTQQRVAINQTEFVTTRGPLPEKFKQVYDYYEAGNNLPEQQYLSNALDSQFQIDPDDHEEFTQVFKSNCKYLKIEAGLTGVTSATGSTVEKAIDTRSLGKPKGEFNRTAFVIMPFSEKGRQERPKGFFDEVLKSVITPAGNEAGFAIETARREDSDIIHHTI